MKFYIVLALALVAFVAIAVAEDDIDSKAKKGVMKSVAELKEFFASDPMGQKLASICKELKDFFLLARTKARSALRDYVKRLMDEGE
ncbi:hypothetical protein ECG_08342 [Echinococcus granulosus]|uniref:Antigen B n=3 Tax=Echinococcus granulosus TaxID=6210 RepID=U6JQF8_ECHGR|nr:Antigen B [Echinococcus granulosus]EUB56071.1 Antigen B [Echinococcus granulosus]KAH9279110.1 hypothetical protein ECG_08342 [Echinococcus granulosus]CDS24107.1 Tapeworm specific antigen B [Echinococcus granulosus]